MGQGDHDHVRDASPWAIRVTSTSDRKEGGRKAFENDVLKKSAELLRFFLYDLISKNSGQLTSKRIQTQSARTSEKRSIRSSAYIP